MGKFFWNMKTVESSGLWIRCTYFCVGVLVFTLMLLWEPSAFLKLIRKSKVLDIEKNDQLPTSPGIDKINKVDKIAFLFLRRDDSLEQNVWDEFFGNENEKKYYNIYVYCLYCDHKTNKNQSYSTNNILSNNLIKTHTDQTAVSLIEVSNILFKYAYNNDPYNTKFILLSESHIPIYNFSYIYNQLIQKTANKKKSFIDMGKLFVKDFISFDKFKCAFKSITLDTYFIQQYLSKYKLQWSTFYKNVTSCTDTNYYSSFIQKYLNATEQFKYIINESLTYISSNGSNDTTSNNLFLRKVNIDPIKTQVRNRGEKLLGPIVDTEHKLLYCAIPKIACVMFKNLFYAIQHNDIYIKQIDYAPNYNHINDENQIEAKLKSIHSRIKNTMDINDYMDIITDRQYQKLVILRDPLERLLSGFLDKCLYGPTNGRFCEGRKTTNFTVFVERIIGKINSNSEIDRHFRPQHSFCNLEETFMYYNNVIIYGYESIGNDTLMFLKSINRDEFYYHWGIYHNETMFKGSKVHVTYNATGTNSSMFYQRYYTKQLAMKCIKAFEIDYKLFNLPLPQWISYLK
eukprot:446767_1